MIAITGCDDKKILDHIQRYIICTITRYLIRRNPVYVSHGITYNEDTACDLSENWIIRRSITLI